MHKKELAILAALFLAITLSLISCNNESEKPIIIGFANTLTGKASTWGLHSRNGAILATEEWNKKGGINGRPINLVFKDDKASGEKAVEVDKELIDMGATAIIGHYLSTVSLQVVPVINKHKMVMISTAASTTKLAGVDDFFFRLVLSNKEIGGSLGKLMSDKLKTRKTAIVSDMSNPGYSGSFIEPFRKEFKAHGGIVATEISFGDTITFSAPEIARKIINSGADGLCLITNAMQGALICQHIKKNNPDIKIVASGWTFSDPNFITTGGTAVEGVLSVNEYNGESSKKSFLSYKERYLKRFEEVSTHPDKVGYEAANILFTALTRNSNPEELKETILEIREFEGVDGTLMIDKFGDSRCRQYVREIRDGKIRTLSEFGNYGT